MMFLACINGVDKLLMLLCTNGNGEYSTVEFGQICGSNPSP